MKQEIFQKELDTDSELFEIFNEFIEEIKLSLRKKETNFIK